MLKDQARSLKEARFHEGELRCDLGTARASASTAPTIRTSLRGLYLDGVVLDEFQQMDPRVWSEVIRPALADRKGWALVTGTPMGRNAFWQLYERAKATPDWQAALYRASETDALPAEELAAARAVMSEEEYAQEFECSFDAAIRGAYYGKAIAQAEAEERIGRCPMIPNLLVHTAWDLGVGDATAIWFYQRHRRRLRLIDYAEASGAGLDHYARLLQARGFAYGEHVLPHDARVQELGSGKTRVETLTALGIRPRVLSAHRVRTASTRSPAAAALLVRRREMRARAGGVAPLPVASGTTGGRRSASGRCTTGRAMPPTRSAIWRWGCARSLQERMPKIVYDDRWIV